MREPWSDGEVERLEAALRGALRTEIAALHLDAPAVDVRRRLAARDRSRRVGRMLMAGAAAVLAVAIALTAGPLVVDRVIGPATTPGASEAAVSVRLDDAGGGRRDLVVETVALTGQPRLLARIPDALATLGGSIDPARAAPGTASATAAYSPDGFVALGVATSDDGSGDGVVLVYDLANPRRTPTRIETSGPSWYGSSVPLAWGPEGRLFAGASSVVEARSGQVHSLDLGDRIMPNALQDPDWAWTGDGRLVIQTGNFRLLDVAQATMTIAIDGSTSVQPGPPTTIYTTTGLGRRGARDGRAAALVSDDGGLRTQGLGTYPESVANAPDTAWWLIGTGEQVVGRPAFDVAGQGIWALVSADRRLDLLHLDGPGQGTRRGSLPWDGDAGKATIVGAAPDNRTLAIRGGAEDLLVDGATGAYRTLPAGGRFAGWARASAIPVGAALPFTCDPSGRGLERAMLEGYPDPTAQAGLAGVTASASAPLASADWRVAEVAALAPVRTTVEARVRLLLPSGTCARRITVSAVPTDDPSRVPDQLQDTFLEPGRGWIEGLHALDAFPPGDWLVRVRLTAEDRSGPWASPSPLPVAEASAGPAGTPPLSTDPSGTPAVDLLFHAIVDGRGATASAAPSSVPVAPRLTVPAPPDPLLEFGMVASWTVRDGSADAPADGVHSFGSVAEPPLRPGPVLAVVACTGQGALRIAAVVPRPGLAPVVDAGRWVRVPCGTGPLDTVTRTVSLPSATGGETLLVVGREPLDAREQLADTIVVGQPVAAACDDPTPESLQGLRLAAGGQAPVPVVLAGYHLPSLDVPFEDWQLEAMARRPAITGTMGGLAEGLVLTLPPGLCAIEWSMVQVPVGGDPAFISGSTGGAEGSGPRLARLTRIRAEATGDTAARLDVTLVGRDGRFWTATLLFHLVLDSKAEASPSP